MVELYEYKVADTVGGRIPRGGKQALAELRHELLRADLDSTLMRRLMVADRQYRDHQAPRPSRAVSETPSSPELFGGRARWSAPAITNVEEAAAWLELHTLLWHHEVAEQLKHLTREMRQEPQRPSLRLLYSVIENATRSLQGNATKFVVPSANDPLVSLGNQDVIEHLTQELIDLLLSAEGRLQVKTALNDVLDNPFPPHPNDGVLAARIEAAEREPISPQAREKLVEALRAQYPQARDPRERPVLRQAARKLVDLFDGYYARLPEALAGVTPKHSILYGQEAVAAQHIPDDGASELVIYLGSDAQDAYWRGMHLQWHEGRANWQFQADDQVAMIRPSLAAGERYTELKLPVGLLQIFSSGKYVLLRIAQQPGEQMTKLATQARAVAALLDPRETYGNLRLARATAQYFRDGKVNLETLAPEGSGRYQDAPPDALQTFVRKGLNTLLTQIAKITPAETQEVLQANAATLHLLPLRVQVLHQALHNAAFNTETIPLPGQQGNKTTAQPFSRSQLLTIKADGQFHSLLMGTEPVTIQAETRMLTLRQDYKGELVALLPGHAGMVLRDLLVLALSDVNYLLIRQGNWVAVAAVPNEAPSKL